MGANKRLALLGIFSTAAIGAIALAACSDDNKGTTAQTTDAGTKTDSGPTADAGMTVKIGVVLGLKGTLAGIAAPVQNTIRVAEDLITVNGGILGGNVQFIIEDDGSNVGAQLTDLMTKFVTKDKVAAIFGPLGSGQVIAAHQIAKDAKIIEMSPSATSAALSTGPLFGGSDRYFFRTIWPDSFQAKAAARFAFDGPADVSVADGGIAGCRRMAIVNIDDDYGKSLAPAITAAFKAKGGDVVYTKQIPTAGKDFSLDNAKAVVADMLSKSTGGAPECQVIVMYEEVAGTYLAAWTAAKASFPAKFFTVGTDGIYTDKFLEEARATKTDPTSQNYANGVYGTNPDTNLSGRAQYDFFKTRYTTKYPLAVGKTDIPPYTASSFDAVMLMALAIQGAGGTSDPVKIRDMLKSVSTPPGTKYGPADFAAAVTALRAGQDIDYQGASGDVDLKDPEGYVDGNYIIWKATQAPGAAPVYSTLQKVPTSDL